MARGVSAVGSALRSHRRGQEFESPTLHHSNKISCADTRYSYFTRCIDGGRHLPSRVSGFGQYNRMAQKNDPSGAGSQFDS